MPGQPKKTIYQYSDTFRMIRWDYPDDRPKKVRPQHFKDGKWVSGDPPKPLPLYKTSDLDNTSVVVVAEGPKCAEKFRELGFQATTSSHGTGSAHLSDWTPLAGRNIVISPDNDAPGEKYRDSVGEILRSLDPPAKVRVMSFRNLPSGGDICDYIERLKGEGRDESAIISTIRRHIHYAKPWKPTNQEKADPAKGEGRNNILYQFAKKLRRQGLGRVEIAERLHDRNNQFSAALPRTEVDGIIKSVIKHKPGKRSSMPSEFQPFPVRCLPDVFHRYVSDEAASVDCDPSFIALPLLVSTAAAIGCTTQLQIKAGWSVPSILWAAIIGDSGTSKSPALSKATTWTQRREASSRAEHDRLLKDYEVQINENQDEEADELQRPVLLRFMCADVTIEALASLLKSSPRGLLVRRDELSGWFGGFDRYTSSSGGDVAAWLELYDGHASTIDRKTGDERAVYIPKSAVSVVGGIQPGPLRRVLGTRNIENGLAPRFLMAYPPSKQKRWTTHTVPIAALKEVEAVFTSLFALPLQRDEHDQPAPVTLTFTQCGEKAFIDFYNRHYLRAGKQTEALKAVYSKLAGNCARLALVIHMVRVASKDDSLKFSGKVDGDSVDRAVELTEWFAREAQRVYDMLEEDDRDTDRRRLIEVIRSMGGSTTADQLRRKTRQVKDAKDAEAALDDLVEAGLGHWVEQPSGKKGGRPTRRFELVLDDEERDDHEPVNSTPSTLSVAEAFKAGNKLAKEAGLIV